MATYVIGFLASMSGYLGYNTYLATQLINNQSTIISQLFPAKNFTISMAYSHVKVDIPMNVDAGYKLMYSGQYDPVNASKVLPPVLGIVGLMGSSVAKSVALLGNIDNVPMVGYGATSPDLSNKNLYKSFCRTVTSDDLETNVIGSMVQEFNWKEIVIISCDSDWCEDYASSVIKKRLIYDYTVKLAVKFSNSDPDSDMENALLAIKETNTRIIIAPHLKIKIMLKYMEKLGMYTSGSEAYVIITPMGSVSSKTPNSIQDEVKNKRSGILTIQYKALSNNLYTNGLKAHWNEYIPSYSTFLQSRGFDTSTINTLEDKLKAGGGQQGWAPYIFDAVLTLTKAIYDLEQSNQEVNRNNISKAIYNINNFEGITGALSFSKNCDRFMSYDVLNLQQNGDQNDVYELHTVASWKPVLNSSTNEGNLVMTNDPINWGTGSSKVPSHHVILSNSNSGLSQEAMILIALASVGSIVGIGLFIRYIRTHYMHTKRANCYDPNAAHRKRVRWQIIKQLIAFIIEIADYVSDALSANVVFGLLDDNVIGTEFVVLYLSVICIGGIANSGNVIARSKNFIDLCHEYSNGVSINDAEMKPETDETGTIHSMEDDIKRLQESGQLHQVNKLEDLTTRISEIKRNLRIEKYTLMLGFLEDLPIAIMNSVLLTAHRNDIEYSVIFVSTLITFLEFGMKAMSFEKIVMLNTQKDYLKMHLSVQRLWSRGMSSNLKMNDVEEQSRSNATSIKLVSSKN